MNHALFFCGHWKKNNNTKTAVSKLDNQHSDNVYGIQDFLHRYFIFMCAQYNDITL